MWACIVGCFTGAVYYWHHRVAKFQLQFASQSVFHSMKQDLTNWNIFAPKIGSILEEIGGEVGEILEDWSFGSVEYDVVMWGVIGALVYLGKLSV